ncbi:MAG: GGDEF domain-containing protein [Butyrivibrio sp.]|nr:GGDEF domain-containing protein [Butyrivibrio sp.]
MSDSYIGICKNLVEKAKDLDDINLLGYSYYYLADACYDLSTEYNNFNDNILKAIEYLQRCGDNEHLARCYNLLGIDALNHGNLELALDFFMTGIRHSIELEKSPASGLIEYNIGQIYFRIADAKTALTYINAAHRHLRRDKGDSMFYRNILFCYSFEADCYMHLDKPDLVRKCLLAIDRLESDPRVKREYFKDIPVLDVRMRGNYMLGNMEEYERYSNVLSQIIQDKKFPFDCLEDVLGVCRFFIETGRTDEVVHFIKNTEKMLKDVNIAYMKKLHAQIKCEMYEVVDDEEEKKRALADFYNYSIALEKESISNYKFFLEIRAKLSDMEQENTALLKKAETDSLTGLGNRYGLNKYADRAFEEAYNERKSLAVEILDVDNFKQFNDNYGHQAGDECLKKIAEIIIEKCAGDDKIHGFRYGGDEFVIIYEDMTDDEVMDHATELRSNVRELHIGSSETTIDTQISISQGIRNFVPEATTKLWDYMYTADNALYEVKKHKKGEIVLLHKAVMSEESLKGAKHS